MPNHWTEYATISGLSIAARFPAEFMVAPTTATWFPSDLHDRSPRGAEREHRQAGAAAMRMAASTADDEAAAAMSTSPTAR